MHSPNIWHHNPQPDDIDQEIEKIDEIDVKHPWVASRFGGDGHLLHVDVVLVAQDPGVGVEAMGAKVEDDEDWLQPWEWDCL